MAIDNYTPEQIEEILQAFFEVAGTRQYIGARYVPIFGRGRGTPIEWDNSDAYEPLSIVYYMGDTYTSRRYVPAGITIDNQDYWVITGRYNAQVEQYRQEVLGFSDRIDGAYDAVDNLRDDVADEYIPFPVSFPKLGSTGQVLQTLTDGNTRWVDPVNVTSDIAGPLIDEWLNDHPEATTTVQDNSVTNAKLVQDGGVLDTLSKTRLSPILEASGYIEASTGQIVSGGVYHYSRLIEVMQGERFYVSASGSGSVLVLAAYATASDAAAQIAKSVAGNGSTKQVVYEVPSGINYIRVCSTGTFDDIILVPYHLYYGNNTSLGNQSNLDLNDVVTPDVYTLTSINASNANKPPAVSSVGLLIVGVSHNNLIYQTFIESYTGNVYSRIKRSGGWDDWAGKPGVKISQEAVTSSVTDMNDITSPGVYTLTASQNSIAHKPDVTSMVGVLKVNTGSGGLIYQEFVPSYDGRVYSRIKRSGGWDAWTTYEPSLKHHEVNVLFVGNSLMQDAIAYLPYVLYNYYNDVKFNIYLWYIAGATLSTQYTAFSNDTPADIFSVAEGVVSWTNHNDDTTMADVLSTYKFDMVVMEEYFNYKSTFVESDLVDWNNCQEYIRAHYTGGNPLKFATFLHAPKRDNAAVIYDRTVAGNELILQKTMAQDIIPAGTAIYRALSTSLNSLGDDGGLSNDGTHAQEGLPCLLQTLCVTAWLMDRLGIQMSVYGFPVKISAATYSGLNVPGPNLGTGVIPGTNAENVLAQQIAVQAFKEGCYYVNNNLYVSGA